MKTLFKKLFGGEEKRAQDGSWDAIKLYGQAGPRLRVSPEQAAGVAAAHAAIEVLTNALATLPTKIYKLTADGQREYQPKHSLAGLLRKPNQHQTWPEFIRDITADLLVFGNGYAPYVDGELIYIPFGLVTVDQLRDSRKLRYRYTLPSAGVGAPGQEVVMADRMLHLKDRGDGLVGRSRLDRCAATLNLAISLQTAAQSLWDHSAMPSGALISKDALVGGKRKELATQLQSQFQGISNRGAVLLLDKDMSYQPLQITPEHAEFIQQRSFAVDEIARVFNVPVTVLNKLDNASYSNAAQQSRFLTSHSLVYWTTLFESAFNDLLLEPDEQLELELNVFTRGEPTERWNNYSIALEKGVLSADEVRALEGYGPRPEQPEQPQPQQPQPDEQGEPNAVPE